MMTHVKDLLSDKMIFSILALIGVWIILSNINQALQYEPRIYTPTTTGTVIHNEVDYRSDPEIYEDTPAYPIVTIAYEVDGQQYHLDGIDHPFPALISDYDTAATRAIERYAIGTTVPLYYNDDPQTAVLQSGLNNVYNRSGTHLGYAFWGLLLALAMFYAIIRESNYTIDHAPDIPKPNLHQRFFNGVALVELNPKHERYESE